MPSGSYSAERTEKTEGGAELQSRGWRGLVSVADTWVHSKQGPVASKLSKASPGPPVPTQPFLVTTRAQLIPHPNMDVSAPRRR